MEGTTLVNRLPTLAPFEDATKGFCSGTVIYSDTGYTHGSDHDTEATSTVKTEN